MSDTVLTVKNLTVEIKSELGRLRAVDGINFELKKGEILGVVGESGCGKSVTSQAILGLLPRTAEIGGSIKLHQRQGQSLSDPLEIATLKNNSRLRRSIRGRDIAMIFQDPMSAFSPVHTVGKQMSEAVLLHVTKDKKEAKRITIDMLKKVGISNAEQRYDEYSLQFSGGMRQRAMIAMALSCEPGILIADEPTTALDVTIQAQVLELLKDIQKKSDMSVIYITHDLGVIAELCDRVIVMYLGQIMEIADVKTLFNNPMHPYTRAMLKSIPRLEDKGNRSLHTIPGNVPVPIGLPPSCPFHERCSECFSDECKTQRPTLTEVESGHYVSCFKCTDGKGVEDGE